jgi:nicotinamidase-related amidase
MSSYGKRVCSIIELHRHRKAIMASNSVIRDQERDALITPKNAALLIIDYQPTQVSSISSRPKRELVDNITAVAELAKAYKLPVVISSVNVKTGKNGPTILQITDVLPHIVPIDRTAINAWEDEDFVAAVRATGRRKLIMAAIWTEVCLAFPALDAIREGFEVYPVMDAVGSTTLEAHEVALRRIEQAGAQPITWIGLACELQRDWNRSATVSDFLQIAFAEGEA